MNDDKMRAHVGGGVGRLEALDEALDGLDVIGVGKERELVEILASAVFGLSGCYETDKNGGSVGHLKIQNLKFKIAMIKMGQILPI